MDRRDSGRGYGGRGGFGGRGYGGRGGFNRQRDFGPRGGDGPPRQFSQGRPHNGPPPPQPPEENIDREKVLGVGLRCIYTAFHHSRYHSFLDNIGVSIVATCISQGM